MGEQAADRIDTGYALDAIALGVIVTDRACRLIYANATADRLLRQGAGALRCSAGKVSAQGSVQDDLRAIVLRTCAQEAIKPGGNYLLAAALETSQPDIALCVVPMKGGDQPGTTHAMMLARPIERGCNLEIEARRLFGLTRMEARFASAIASGLSLVEAAQAYGVTLATARSHLKGVFRKTGAARQSQVAALLRGAQIPVQLA